MIEMVLAFCLVSSLEPYVSMRYGQWDYAAAYRLEGGLFNSSCVRESS